MSCFVYTFGSLFLSIISILVTVYWTAKAMTAPALPDTISIVSVNKI